MKNRLKNEFNWNLIVLDIIVLVIFKINFKFKRRINEGKDVKGISEFRFQVVRKFARFFLFSL